MQKLSPKIELLIHDIKNPLTAGIISCEYILTLLEKERTKSIKEINDIVQEILESLNYINDLLELNSKNIRFNVVSEIKKLMNISADKASFNLKASCNKDLFIYGDPIKFKRVILNLVKNAYEALATKVLIEVSTGIKNKILISVFDNGVGVSQDISSLIFKKGFSTKTSNKNCGLGLYSCKQIIEKDFNGKLILSDKTEKFYKTRFDLIFLDRVA